MLNSRSKEIVKNGAVTKFKVGDIGGVGCMVNSCDICENCLADREQNCLAGATFTYNLPEAVARTLRLGIVALSLSAL